MRVTDEMVRRLSDHLKQKVFYGTLNNEARDTKAREFLEVALSHAAGQDGEQCRAAWGGEPVSNPYTLAALGALAREVYFSGWLNAAAWADRDDLLSDRGSNAYLILEDEAVGELLRALSRGVPEGRQVLPEGWRVSIERGIPGVMWLELNGPKCSTSAQARKQDDVQWRIYERFEAAIAAQRKEG